MPTWTPEQQKEHRRLWVEALRSGKYQQARDALRRGEAMCCLGVACEVSGLGVWDGTDYAGRPLYVVPGEDAQAMVLPATVRNWLGLRRTDSEYSGARQLTLDNDSGVPFARIADIIESEPEGLLAP